MELNIFRIAQLFFWTASLVLIVLAIMGKYPITDKPEEVIELLGLLTAASVAIGEIYKNKVQKFSAANVLAVGYVKNCIEPLVKGLLKMKTTGTSATNGPIYILMPESIHDVTNVRTETELVKNELKKEKESIEVSTSNRERMEISVAVNKSGRRIYYDVPNTISSLEALISYKLPKESDEEGRIKLGKKYLTAFEKEVEKVMSRLRLADHTRIIHSFSEVVFPEIMMVAPAASIQS